jgi:hypothetical protein
MMPLEACKAARSTTELAAMCGTSTQAATYRLQQLAKQRLLDPERYKGH